jgi:nucleoside-diphosphate-sugar epimerase
LLTHDREVERQSDAFARRYPDMRIGSIRPHWVIPESLAYDPVALDAEGGTAKDLWGWVSIGATARAFMLGLTAPESTFPLGHETFFIVAPTLALRTNSMDLLRKEFPEVTTFKREIKGNDGFFNCSKAQRMLGWTERAFPWTPE